MQEQHSVFFFSGGFNGANAVVRIVVTLHTQILNATAMQAKDSQPHHKQLLCKLGVALQKLVSMLKKC